MGCTMTSCSNRGIRCEDVVWRLSRDDISTAYDLMTVAMALLCRQHSVCPRYACGPRSPTRVCRLLLSRPSAHEATSSVLPRLPSSPRSCSVFSFRISLQHLQSGSSSASCAAVETYDQAIPRSSVAGHWESSAGSQRRDGYQYLPGRGCDIRHLESEVSQGGSLRRAGG